MNEPLALIGAGASGLALGVIFFGGLWWTVRESTASRHPALWFGVSLLVRVGIVLAGFYFVAGPHWQRLLVCLIGFALARLLVTRLIGSAGRVRSQGDSSVVQETGHAP